MLEERSSKPDKLYGRFNTQKKIAERTASLRIHKACERHRRPLLSQLTANIFMVWVFLMETVF